MEYDLLNGNSMQFSSHGMRRMRIPGGYDPCYSPYAAEYFNRPDVQSALHAGRGNGTVKWETCR